MVSADIAKLLLCFRNGDYVDIKKDPVTVGHHLQLFMALWIIYFCGEVILFQKLKSK
jgi:hypothetical protein